MPHADITARGFVMVRARHQFRAAVSVFRCAGAVFLVRAWRRRSLLVSSFMRSWGCLSLPCRLRKAEEQKRLFAREAEASNERSTAADVRLVLLLFFV